MFEHYIQGVPISQFLLKEDLKVKSQNPTTSAASKFQDQTDVRKLLSQILEEKHLFSESPTVNRKHLPSPQKQKQSFHLIQHSSSQKKSAPTPDVSPQKNMIPLIQRMAYLQNMQIITNLKQSKQQLQNPVQVQSSILYDPHQMCTNSYRKASSSEVHNLFNEEEDKVTTSPTSMHQQFHPEVKNNSEVEHISEENHEVDDKENDKKFTFSKQKIKRQKLRNKKPNVCGHTDREHYAKNMCKNCYHKHGRTKRPWLCEHDKLYAHGLCQNCYINKYNQDKNIKKHQASHK